MADKEDRDLDVILRIIQLTQEGKLEWEAVKPWGDLKSSETRSVESVFCADFEDKKLRAYVERTRQDTPGGLQAFLNPDRKYPYWNTSNVLELTNQAGASLWQFPPKSAAMRDLMNAIRYQAAGVKELYSSLLGSKQEK